MRAMGLTRHTKRYRPDRRRSTRQARQKRSIAMDHRRPIRTLVLPSMNWTRSKDPSISLGPASILAALRAEQIPVIHKAWSVNSSSFNLLDVQDFIMRHANQDVDLALGAYVWHEPDTQRLLNALKEHEFPGRIILGGPQISYTKKDIEAFYPQADIFIRGYGESALAQLCLSDQDSPVIAGVHYAGKPDLGLSANVDLEQLPSPYLTGLLAPQPFMRWETQRGCPFRCAFCQHRESDVSMTRRELPASRIQQEIEWILDHPVIQDIAVLDPTFNSGSQYMEILQAFIRGRYSGKLALQCRIEMVKDEFLEAVQALNKTGEVVLEFGLQTANKHEAAIIQRPNNMRKVSRILNKTREMNITTEVSLIFGLPGQTVASFQESIQFCKDHGVPTIYAYPLMLLRGTPLYAAKEKLGLRESTDVEVKVDRVQDNIPHVIASPSFTEAQWCMMAAMAEELDAYNAKQANESSAAKMRSTLRHTLFGSSQGSTDLKHQQSLVSPIAS